MRLRLARRETPWVRDNSYGTGQVETTGYHFVYAEYSMLADEDDRSTWLDRHRALVCYAAGVTHVTVRLLQSPELSPSFRLTLFRDRDNPYDPNAVSLRVSNGQHVGWVPRGDAAAVAARLDAGEELACAVVEQVHDDSGRRVAFAVLIAAPEVVAEAFARARPWTG